MHTDMVGNFSEMAKSVLIEVNKQTTKGDKMLHPNFSKRITIDLKVSD
jgi:hypothetical protein